MNTKQKVRLITFILMCVQLAILAVLAVLNLLKVISISLYGWLWLAIAFYITAVIFYFSVKDLRK